MEFKYSTPEKTDIKRALGSKCGCFCHSGTNSTSQLIPQVFNGVEDRTTGRLFHPLHSQTDSRRNYTRASVLAQVVPKKSTSPKLNDYQTAALTACDKGTVDTILAQLRPRAKSSLNPQQFAHRTNVEAITYILQGAYCHLDSNGCTVRITFFDFASAFNTISSAATERESTGNVRKHIHWQTGHSTWDWGSTPCVWWCSVQELCRGLCNLHCCSPCTSKTLRSLALGCGTYRNTLMSMQRFDFRGRMESREH